MLRNVFLLALLIGLLLPFDTTANGGIKKKRMKTTAGSRFTSSNSLSLAYTCWEVGALIGESHYYGDLSKGLIQFPNMHLNYGAYLRFQKRRNWAYKLMVNKGSLSGDDKNNLPKLVKRNLNFTSELYEGALMAEYMYPEFTACKQYNWAPYVTFGVAVFHFQPMNKFGDLRSLSTEGQGTSQFPDRKPYSLTQVSIPLGIGIKFIPVKQIIIGLEVDIRKTFTDYIDDVSTTYPDPAVLLAEKGASSKAASYTGTYKYPRGTPKGRKRGNPKMKDCYVTAVFTIGYCFKYNCQSEKYRFNDVGGCKTF